MGLYINPRDCDKEEWLARHAVEMRETPYSTCVERDAMAVCSIYNGSFIAAGVAYNERELAAFSSIRDRGTMWLRVPINDLCTVLGVSREVLLAQGEED